MASALPLDLLPPELIENIVRFMDPDSIRDLFSATKNEETRELILSAALRNGIYMKKIHSRAFNASRGATKTEEGMNVNEILLFLKKFYEIVPDNLQRHYK